MRLQEDCLAKQRTSFVCFVDVVKTLDGVERKVMEWAMRKKHFEKHWLEQ